MGWTVGPQTREELITELLGPRHHETVAHTVIGNHLWCVKRYLRDGQERKYIALFILEAFGAFEYGYKDMDETQHPYYYDCPLEFLELVEPFEARGSAADWRECVRAWHAGGSVAQLRLRLAQKGSQAHG